MRKILDMRESFEETNRGLAGFNYRRWDKGYAPEWYGQYLSPFVEGRFQEWKESWVAAIDYSENSKK